MRQSNRQQQAQRSKYHEKGPLQQHMAFLQRIVGYLVNEVRASPGLKHRDDGGLSGPEGPLEIFISIDRKKFDDSKAKHKVSVIPSLKSRHFMVRRSWCPD